MNIVEVQASNRTPVATILNGSFEGEPHDSNEHSIFRPISTQDALDHVTTTVPITSLPMCRVISTDGEGPALDAPALDAPALVCGTFGPSFPPPTKKEAPKVLPAWHPQRIFKAITFDNDDSLSSTGTGSVADQGSMVSELTEAESFLPAEVGQHHHNNTKPGMFSPLAKADVFHFGANINSVEKSVGRNVMQSMLSDLLEKNQELTRTVRRLSEAHTIVGNIMDVVPIPDKHITNETLPVNSPSDTATATSSSRKSQSTGVLLRKQQDANLVVAQLRAQNERLLRDLGKAERKRKKQVMKAQYWKDLARDAGVGICDSESDMSSVSYTSSIRSHPYHNGPMDIKSIVGQWKDDADSVGASKDHLALPERRKNPTLPLNSNFVISGLAAYQFRQLVSDLQGNVKATNTWSKRDKVLPSNNASAGSVLASDNLDDIFAAGALKYATHVQEQVWAYSTMTLRWEPVPEHDKVLH